ncbi:MAG: hypothetical protein ACI4V1_00340 [Eubacteriales bacterium]
MNLSSKKPFYFVKNGKPACSLVYSGVPFPPEIYSEVSPPEPVSDTPERQYTAILALRERIRRSANVLLSLYTAEEAEKISGAKAFLGKMRHRNSALLGESNAYQFVLAAEGEHLVTAAWTPGGYLDAIRKVSDALVISDDRQDVYLPEKAFGVYDRIMREVMHAFPKFTVSIYGAPGQEEDERVFRDLVNFGIDQMPLNVNPDEPADVERVRRLIEKFHAEGIGVRLYGNLLKYRKEFLLEGNRVPTEQQVRRLTEQFADMDGVVQWGFFDEPDTQHFEFCAFVKRCLEKYDPKKRPVYINLGPRAHCRGVQSFYERYAELVHPDYYCLDRYPFFQTERGAEMNEDYFYAHLELNRSNAIDGCVDAGLILTAIRVGADTLRADITQEFMNWQTNMLAAYGCRYLEQYVYYYVHDYCILGPGRVPTFRWAIAKKANDYLHVIMPVLLEKRLDAVFHLPRADGEYDIDTIPYHPYHGAGEVRGIDAVLSFFDDGTIVVTDKRCDDFRGGDHEIVLTGVTGDVEWFNPKTADWEEIGSCPALVSHGADGLTLNLARATQYILRE